MFDSLLNLYDVSKKVDFMLSLDGQCQCCAQKTENYMDDFNVHIINPYKVSVLPIEQNAIMVCDECLVDLKILLAPFSLQNRYNCHLAMQTYMAFFAVNKSFSENGDYFCKQELRDAFWKEVDTMTTHVRCGFHAVYLDFLIRNGDQVDGLIINNNFNYNFTTYDASLNLLSKGSSIQHLGLINKMRDAATRLRHLELDKLAS